MRHPHKDGPDNVPAHVLARLPREIRYRINTIGDVIDEMGYAWYCENAGYVNLSSDFLMYPNDDFLPPDINPYYFYSPTPWTRQNGYSLRLPTQFPFDSVIEINHNPLSLVDGKHSHSFPHGSRYRINETSDNRNRGPRANLVIYDSSGNEKTNPFIRYYKFSAGHLHAWVVYWSHFRHMFAGESFYPDQSWVPRYSPFNHFGYMDYQPFLLPGKSHTRQSRYVKDFLDHADGRGLILKDQYSGGVGSRKFSEKSVGSYARFVKKPDRSQEDTDGDFEFYNTASTSPSNTGIRFFSSDSHMVDVDGDPLRVGFKASYLSHIAAKIYNHATQKSGGFSDNLPNRGFPDQTIFNLKFPLTRHMPSVKHIGSKLSDSSHIYLRGRLPNGKSIYNGTRLAADAPHLDGRLDRGSLALEELSFSISENSLCRWDQGFGQIQNNGTSLPTSGPIPAESLKRVDYYSTSRFAQDFVFIGSEGGDFGTPGPASEMMFAHAAKCSFHSGREFKLNLDDDGELVPINAYLNPFPETGKFRVIIDAKDPDNYLFGEIVFAREKEDTFFRGAYSEGFMGSTLRIGKRTSGSDSIIAVSEGCPMILPPNAATGSNKSFKLLAGVRKVDGNWKVYAALLANHLILEEYADWDDVNNLKDSDGNHRCRSQPTGSFLSDHGQPLYLIEGNVTPHFGKSFGAGARDLESDARIAAFDLEGFGNPGFYFSDSEPENNDLKTSIQSSEGLKSHEAYYRISDDKRAKIKPGYWETNTGAGLQERTEACVPFSKTGHPWRFQDMVDLINFGIEPGDTHIPGTMPCDLETSSQAPYVRRKSPKTVSVEISVPTGGHIQKNMPFWELSSDQCTVGTTSEVVAAWGDSFDHMWDAYQADQEDPRNDGSAILNPCTRFVGLCECYDHPRDGCWNSSEWDSYCGDTIATDFTCPESGQGNHTPGYGMLNKCHRYTFSIYRDLSEFTTIGYDTPAQTEYIAGTSNRCESYGNYLRDWETTGTIAGSYQLNLHPMQGPNCVEVERWEKVQDYKENAFTHVRDQVNTGVAGFESLSSYGLDDANPTGVNHFPSQYAQVPTLFTGSFQVSNWCRLHLVASFNQLCRDPTNPEHRDENVALHGDLYDNCSVPSGCSNTNTGNIYTEKAFTPWSLAIFVEFTDPYWGTSAKKKLYYNLGLEKTKIKAIYEGTDVRDCDVSHPFNNLCPELSTNTKKQYDCNGDTRTCFAFGRVPVGAYGRAMSGSVTTSRWYGFNIGVTCLVDNDLTAKGGTWELTVKNPANAGAFCNEYVMSSTFDGALSEINVANDFEATPRDTKVCVTEFENIGTGMGHNPDIEKYGQHMTNYVDFRPYIGNQFFYLSSKDSRTQTGSGLKLPTMTNFGAVAQLYNVTLTVSS